MAFGRRFLIPGIPAPRAAPPVLAHQDFACEHVLIDPATGRATGVIDWADATLGDPADDFAGVLAWLGETFLGEVLARYTGPADAGLVGRARVVAAIHGAVGAWYGLEGGRPEHLAAGLRALEFAVPS